MKLTQTTGPTLGGKKPRGRKNSTLKPGKGDLKHNKLKYIYNEKAEKYYTNGGTNQKHRSPNKEEIDKLPEKEFRIIIVR